MMGMMLSMSLIVSMERCIMYSVFVISDISYGGGLTYLKSLLQLNIFSKIIVVSLGDQVKQKSVCDSLGVDFRPFSWVTLYNLRESIFIFNSVRSVLYAAPILFFLRRKIYVSHGMANGFEYMSNIRRSIYRLIVNFPKLEILSCGYDELEKNLDLTYKKQNWCVPNGINFGRTSRLLDQQTHLSTVVFFGRISFQKGFDLLLKSLAGTGLNLKVYGDWESDQFRRKCEELIVDLFLKVQFFGYVPIDDVSLKEKEVCILPSRFEGLPYTVLELTDLGVPTIISDCRGHKELLDDRDELRFESESVEQLRCLLMRFSEINIGKSLSVRRRKVSKYTMERFEDEMRAVFT